MITGFPEDLITIRGWELECLAASIFQTLNYRVDVNLKWLEDRVDNPGTSDILEIDILAKSYSPLKVTKILVECKKNCNFNDLFLFKGISDYVNVDEKYLLCESHQFSDIYNLGLENKINVVKSIDIFDKFNVSKVADKLELWRTLNYILTALLNKKSIQDILHTDENLDESEKEAYNNIRKYLISLNGRIWKENDPRKQYQLIKQLFEDNKDFVGKISRIISLPKTGAENLMRDNALCQAAGYAVLKAKVAYIICAVECAINSIISPYANYLDSLDDESFKSCVILMKDNLLLACKIPNFIQAWVYLFGGVLNDTEDDVVCIANFLDERPETIKNMLELLKSLFTLLDKSNTYEIQWGFFEDFGITHFKYVPHPIRGLGIYHRQVSGIDVDDFCYHQEWYRAFNNWLKTVNLDIGGK